MQVQDTKSSGVVNKQSTSDELFQHGIGHNGGPEIEDCDGIDSLTAREGFVAISRKIREHWLVGFGQPVKPCDPEKPFCYSRGEAWMDLIMECKYESGTVNNNGRKMKLEAGQLLGAVSWLASRWNWTPKTVRGFLDKLENEGLIAKPEEGQGKNQNSSKKGRPKGRLANVLTICKYEVYQLSHRHKGQVERQVEGKLGASCGQVEGDIYKDKQGNKGTKEQIDSPKSPQRGPGRAACLKAFGRWNDMAEASKLQQASKMTPGREKSIRARLREFGDDGWEQALRNVHRSAFLRGNNDRGWQADIDWFIGPKNFAKVHDGRYGNGAHAKTSSQMTDEERRLAGIIGGDA